MKIRLSPILVLIITIQILNITFALAQIDEDIPKHKVVYKFRDNNRYEGVKFKSKNEKSSSLELASLVYYGKEWRRIASHKRVDSISVFYRTPNVNRLNLSVFDPKTRYFMEPKFKKSTKKGHHIFIWPATILNTINLPSNVLLGKVHGRLKNKRTFFPLYFQQPDSIKTDLIAEISFVPDKDIKCDVDLKTSESSIPIKQWKNIEIKSGELKTIYWDVDIELLGNSRTYELIVIEKIDSNTNRKPISFYIYNE